MQAPVTPPEFYVEEEQPHLGGYIVGGDPATYYPQLWEWLVREQGVRSVIDVGCGEGHAGRHFGLFGCRMLNIDGIDQPGLADFWRFDFTDGPFPGVGTFDLAWSCEFVEHVEERYIANFLAAFMNAKMVAMTHAEPEQPGHHHVNCRTADYWIGALAAAGFRYDAETTGHARLMAGMNRNPINHFARSGLVFRRA
jgi:SAM-dependent methyltransferase